MDPSSTRFHLIAPTSEESSLAREAIKHLTGSSHRKLRICLSDSKEEIALPATALRLLLQLLSELADGNAVNIIPVHAELTTQQAADFLNVSRPYFVKLLERGKVPYRKVGTRRRVMFKDLEAYRESQAENTRKAVDELTRQSQEIGLG